MPAHLKELQYALFAHQINPMKHKQKITVSWIITLTLICLQTLGQTTVTYSVYKLENKIGTEVAVEMGTGNETTYKTTIETSDRGSKLSLSATVKFIGEEPAGYTVRGNTSRFKTEVIDTVFTSRKTFPISNSGSIKIKELLVKYWDKNNRPAWLSSAVDRALLSIHVLDTLRLPVTNEQVVVLEIIKGTDPNEIIWINKDGNAVFLAACDSEGDKRETISDQYTGQFDFFTNNSTAYLIRTYKDKNAELGKSFENIAIIGGSVIDIINGGSLIPNCMVLLKSGKIDYIGKIDRKMVPADAHVINAENQYIIPGLWDMHLHAFHPDDLKRSLLSGVTTVRDMANEFDFINQLEKLTRDSQLPSPTLYRAGIIEGKSADALGNLQVSTPAEIAKKIKLYHDAGFNQIKVYSKVSKKNIAVINEQAKLYHMDMVGHTPDGTTLKYCVENGMKIVSHIHYFMNSLKWKNSDFINENQELIGLLKNRGVAVDATLNVYSSYEPYKMNNYKRVTRFLSDQGIPVVTGTDNGKISEELALFVSAGISPLDAIRAATIVPAKVMKADRETGSVEKGKNSDLLILSANPLIDIKNIEKISTVVKGSFVVKIDEGDREKR